MEFYQIKDQLKTLLTSAVGRAELNELQPTNDLKTVQEKIDETKDGFDILQITGGLHIPKLDDINPHVKRLSMNGQLNGVELSEVSLVLQTVSQITTLFANLDDQSMKLRKLYQIVNQLVQLPTLTQRLKVSLELDGRLTDSASPELKRIRQRIMEIESTIRNHMNNYIRGKESKFLSDNLVTVRDDRYVLPVRAENKYHFGGIVHDQSASGHTLYIEPQKLVSENNLLREFKLAELQEEHRILLELSEALRPYQYELIKNSEILGHLDFINAKAIYAHDLHATEPLFSVDNHVSLWKARHPLIAIKHVVANDIEIGENHKIIILTGPNTGGKTIILKTLGLVQLMAQSGLFIPAKEKSTVGLFDEVFADIGDDQSIEKNLSTFSSHIENIKRILDLATENSLILIDELGAGTDSKEGSSLAIAILDEIGNIGSNVFVTSHYPELKAYGYNHPKSINASMEFNNYTLKPTYRLLIGIPGSSNALNIAQHLGISSTIISEARELIDSDSQNVNKMIADLIFKQRTADEYVHKISEELDENDRLHQELQINFDRFLKQKDQLMTEAKQQANQIIDEAEKQANQIIKELRKKQLDVGKMKIKEKELIGVKGRIKNLHHDTTLKKNRVLTREKRKHQLKLGDEVLVRSYGQRGIILDKRDKNQFEVQVGILKMNINANDLEKVTVKGSNEHKQRTTVYRTRSAELSPTLDLRGIRYEAAMTEVDQFIDSSLLAGYRSVTIIHGKGTGVLRQGVTKYLQSNYHIKSFGFSPANAGGDGSTIVKL